VTKNAWIKVCWDYWASPASEILWRVK
jgi:hypothetical protein